MRNDILQIAQKKFLPLLKRYPGFINVILDDWRGYRLIYDTQDVRGCNNNCSQCPLYKLLKNEPEGLFSLGLNKASAADRKLFGPQQYLNCKTIEQYQQCYINFLFQKANTSIEIKEELSLIHNLRVIYSAQVDARKKEREFKRGIYRVALAKGDIQLSVTTSGFLKEKRINI